LFPHEVPREMSVTGFVLGVAIPSSTP
jgi:hypothetical protein